MKFFVAFSLVASLLGATTTRISAWTPTTTSRTRPQLFPKNALSLRTSSTSPSSTCLLNVPPPSTDDTVAFRAYASKQSPPASFFELQQDCIRSAKLAIEDGIDLLEVEFPPLPANILELDDVSAYDVAQANLKLAVDFAKGFAVEGKKVAILLPDEDEARIAMEQYTGVDDNPIARQEISPGITLASIRQSEEGDERFLKVRH